MQTKTRKVLPKILNGTVHRQFVKCGKDNCRCAVGELHGAYFYHFERIEGKLRKRYLKTSEVEAFKTACRNRQELNQQIAANALANWELFRSLREIVRDSSNSRRSF